MSAMKVGVMLPLDRDADEPQPWSEIRSVAVGAEEAGFDSVWSWDHLFIRKREGGFAGMWEGWTALAAVAAVTERVELGTLVLCTSFRNAGLIAKMAATLDEISAGRVILGIGPGWHEPEFDAFGFDFPNRVNDFERAIVVARALLRGEELAEGPIRGPLLPPGPRAAHGGPPILVAASRPRMLRLTARHADAWNAAWYPGPGGGFAREREALLRACDLEGRDPASIEITAGVSVSYPSYTGEIDPDEAVGGSPAAVADALNEFAEAGVGTAMCVQPPTRRDLDWLAEALALLRA